jgi:hypothetical protein
MNSTLQILLYLSIALVGFGLFFIWQARNRSRSKSTENHEVVSPLEAEALIFGSVEKPLLEIHPALETRELVPLEATPAMKMALEPILQRAPEMLHLGSKIEPVRTLIYCFWKIV